MYYFKKYSIFVAKFVSKIPFKINMTKSKILVLTNFNPQSEVALLQSIYFANKTDSDIILLHIIKGTKSANKSKSASIQNKLNKIIENYKGSCQLVFNSRIEYGKVIPEILKVEKEIKPEFIFIGTERDSKPFNSTTINLIDEVGCPVIVLSGRNMSKGCESIVLPLDLSKETKQKVDVTLNIAKTYDATVHIISATSDKDKKIEEKIKKQILSVKKVFDKNNVSCKTELLVKNNKATMANAIIDYAHKINAGLIVIMTRQETSIEKFFVGSMATRIIKKASIPVLCISPKC